jgi:hypothetical protein
MWISLNNLIIYSKNKSHTILISENLLAELMPFLFGELDRIMPAVMTFFFKLAKTFHERSIPDILLHGGQICLRKDLDIDIEQIFPSNLLH